MSRNSDIRSSTLSVMLELHEIAIPSLKPARATPELSHDRMSFDLFGLLHSNTQLVRNLPPFAARACHVTMMLNREKNWLIEKGVGNETHVCLCSIDAAHLWRLTKLLNLTVCKKTVMACKDSVYVCQTFVQFNANFQKPFMLKPTSNRRTYLTHGFEKIYNEHLWKLNTNDRFSKK